MHAMQNGNASLAAAATHLLTKMIKINDKYSIQRGLKVITELWSEGYPRCR
jgi:hypothetical protein